MIPENTVQLEVINDQKKTQERLKHYFANKPRNEIAAALMGKYDDYWRFLETSGRLDLIRRSYRYYYRGAEKAGMLQSGGEQGEFLIGHFNHYRNIIQHLLNMTTSDKPALEPRASNTDAKSQAQTMIASGVLDYYQRERHLDRIFKKATEQSLYAFESYVCLEWDESLGSDYALDDNTGNVKKNGDIRITNIGPLDIAYDFYRDSPTKHDWRIVRFWENKYDYAAKYPEFSDKIINLSSSTFNQKQRKTWYSDISDSDLIPVYRFYHEKTPAVPEGRFTEYLAADITTLDGPLPYRRVNIYPIMPDNLDGTCLGYSIVADLMPIQEAIDGLINTILTNAATFGVQNIAIPEGGNIDVVSVSGGLNVIKYDSKSGEPKVLQMLSIPPELFKFTEMLIGMMETLSGLNSVVRGNPEASLKSGAALALIASQAVQFNSGLQQAYVSLCEDVGTGIIDILKQYANTPRIASISGKSNRVYLKEFTGEDLNGISRVTAERVNALSSTTAGKMQIGDALLERNLIKTPEEYLQIVTNGRLEPLYKAEQTQLMLVQAENEDLSEGKKVTALMTDDHVLHIKEHQVIFSSREARENPELIKNGLEHLQQHIDMLVSGSPILSILGQPQIAPPMPPNGPPTGNGSEVVDATNPITKDASTVNLPSQPTNPQTGEKYVPRGTI
jgi:hypothetical protein